MSCHSMPSRSRISRTGRPGAQAVPSGPTVETAAIKKARRVARGPFGNSECLNQTGPRRREQACKCSVELADPLTAEQHPTAIPAAGICDCRRSACTYPYLPENSDRIVASRLIGPNPKSKKVRPERPERPPHSFNGTLIRDTPRAATYHEDSRRGVPEHQEVPNAHARLPAHAQSPPVRFRGYLVTGTGFVCANPPGWNPGALSR